MLGVIRSPAVPKAVAVAPVELPESAAAAWTSTVVVAVAVVVVAGDEAGESLLAAAAAVEAPPATEPFVSLPLVRALFETIGSPRTSPDAVVAEGAADGLSPQPASRTTNKAEVNNGGFIA